MTKEEFRELFLKNVRQALVEAESRLGFGLPSDFDVELHGGGRSGAIVSVNDALDAMYLGEDSFYRVIDIGVKAVVGNRAIVFVRISAHNPTGFNQTWNDPKGNGPFKVISSVAIATAQ